ncbi:hypothetical protein ACQPXM_06115 [Kribbella sp. CA-253562]
MVSLDKTLRPAAACPARKRRWRRWLAAALAMLVAALLFGAYGW